MGKVGRSGGNAPSRREAVVKEKAPGKERELPVARAEGFKKTYGTRVLVMRTEFDLRLLVTNELVRTEEGGEAYISESMVILTPLAAKELASDLGRTVRDWERDQGRIEDRPRKSRFTEQAI